MKQAISRTNGHDSKAGVRRFVHEQVDSENVEEKIGFVFE
jgi:hypothetical protein